LVQRGFSGFRKNYFSSLRFLDYCKNKWVYRVLEKEMFLAKILYEPPSTSRVLDNFMP